MTAEDVDSVGMLSQCCALDGDRLYLGVDSDNNYCKGISMNKQTIHVGEFNINNQRELLPGSPSWQVIYHICTIETVEVNISLSRYTWRNLACIVAHCTIKKLVVNYKVLENADTEDLDFIEANVECFLCLK